MLLQIISDIHLEFHKIPYIPVKAPIIALLGDIGYPHSKKYQLLINDLSLRFKHVIVLAGNHEFYGKDIHKTIRKITDICRNSALHYVSHSELASQFTNSNVYFLNNSSVVIDGVEFLGATLWTHIPPKKWKKVMRECNDYSEIKFSRRENLILSAGNEVPVRNVSRRENLMTNLTPKDTTKFHKESVEYLRKNVTENSIVLTHHAPTFGTIENKVISPEDADLEPCWSATEIVGIKPKLWAYGHTHYPADFVHNGIRYYSNPSECDSCCSDVYSKTIEV